MMLSKIWQRYLFKELIKVFILFLAGFFLLYAIIDYSTHMQDFIKDKRIQLSDVLLYYSYQFVKRSDLLLPLALLVAAIKVLTTFNASRELVALQVSGLKTKKIFQPLFLLASLCCLFNFACEEWILPQSLNYLDKFREAHFRHSFKGKRKDPFFVLHLKDNSKLVYQEYDAEKNAFFDVFWIRSFDDIWRIKFLKADPKDPIGEFADHLIRNSEGFLEKKESFDRCLMPSLKWQTNLPRKGMIPIENRKISQLYRLLFTNESTTEYQAGEIATQLAFKLAIPLLPLLVIVGVTPFCVRYSRSTPTFMLYAIGIFSFIALFTMMDAFVILGENQTLPPFIAVFIPMLCSTALFGWKYIKLT
jgi:lipopolysaccharide export system permease protein